MLGRKACDHNRVVMLNLPRSIRAGAFNFREDE